MKKKLLLAFLTLVLLYATGGVYYNVYYKDENVQKNTVKNVEKINGYKYTLKSNSTVLYKKEFKLLKTNLESKTIDEEAYAKSVGKLFIIDLYTISNKVNKYDVGGCEFVFPTALTSYKNNVEDTIYKYVEDNSSKTRNQELPTVITITISSADKTTYKIGETSYDGYKIKLSWTYEKDLNYDDTGELIVIKKDKYYYVAEKN